MNTTVKKKSPRLYTVKAKKGLIVISQVLTNEDQAKRWEALVKENGYEVIK